MQTVWSDIEDETLIPGSSLVPAAEQQVHQAETGAAPQLAAGE